MELVSDSSRTPQLVRAAHYCGLPCGRKVGPFVGRFPNQSESDFGFNDRIGERNPVWTIHG